MVYQANKKRQREIYLDDAFINEPPWIDLSRMSILVARYGLSDKPVGYYDPFNAFYRVENLLITNTIQIC